MQFALLAETPRQAANSGAQAKWLLSGPNPDLVMGSHFDHVRQPLPHSKSLYHACVVTDNHAC